MERMVRDERQDLFLNDRLHVLLADLCNASCKYCFNENQGDVLEHWFLDEWVADDVANFIVKHDTKRPNISF